MVRAVAALLPGGAKRGEIAFGQRRLRWIEAGTGGPTVVLDAASGTPALTWLPILPALVPHNTSRPDVVADAVLAVVGKARLGHGT